ncbi:septal ring lytic transglycosylase RlpA family protein [Chromohalobacter canadensis]|nr:septal ring lytic transglycosylase RlpA family protein [Chromohalobacter canadensis]MCT8470343.1 septal ring lytic transglycosylase RlpA family protein [Chromohalobacter canadensis]MCT8498405.1 septal ring lytic transglycosylase RlpA family protein [Chromohalobacter canadensis]
MVALAGCATDGGETPGATSNHGQASYYHDRYQGQRTASGEPYDAEALTAAHRELPFGTRVRVTNLDNGHHVTVRINDRGPFTEGRVIDLSRRAAERLGMIKAGTAPVRVTPLP